MNAPMGKDMRHAERMKELGETVTARIRANELMVSPQPLARTKGMGIHVAAAKRAGQLRYT